MTIMNVRTHSFLTYISAAINIPVGEFIRECTQPSPSLKFVRVKDAPKVAIYCGDGTRSQLVIDFARGFGLTHLEKLEGGYTARIL